MNPEVGSIMRYFHNLFPVKVYKKEVPSDFAVPSLYFPIPTAFDSNDTNMTFTKTYSLSVKLFHEDSVIANDRAEMIADEVRSSKNVIPMVNPEGELTGDYIRISKIETRIGDNGVATIIVGWDSNYHYSREEWPALRNLELYSEVK
ncbi:phage portal protein [Lentibacillus sp. N15]|uniref:phage portal protein n=1 Tax=Lentibacillus songyuanensis TaxID=3136161 RepID=UPI0031BA3241